MKKFLFGFLRAYMRANSVISGSNQRKLDEKISRALEAWIVDKKYCIPNQTIQDVADELDVSAEAFSYYCTTVLGERFGSFRKKLRIEEAKRIIEEEPECKMVNVAFRVGIHDKCNFRRQFFEICGCPPSEWKKRCLRKKKES